MLLHLVIFGPSECLVLPTAVSPSFISFAPDEPVLTVSEALALNAIPP